MPARLSEANVELESAFPPDTAPLDLGLLDCEGQLGLCVARQEEHLDIPVVAPSADDGEKRSCLWSITARLRSLLKHGSACRDGETGAAPHRCRRRSTCLSARSGVRRPPATRASRVVDLNSSPPAAGDLAHPRAKTQALPHRCGRRVNSSTSRHLGFS